MVKEIIAHLQEKFYQVPCFQDCFNLRVVSIGKVQQVKCDAKLNVVKGKNLPKVSSLKNV
jgi:hypothetical protein